MKRSILIFVITFAFGLLNAQVGINTTNPDPNALVDISSTDKGFTLPSFNMANSSDITFLAAPPKESLIFYNTNSAIPNSGKALYYWNGNNWDFVFNESNSNLFENLVRYHSAVTSNVYSSNSYTATTYNKGEVLNTSEWTILDDLTQTINITRPLNDTTYILSGMIQATNSTSQTGVYLLTMGIFVDDILVDIKPLYFNASISCGYKSVKFVGSSKDITIGNHTIKFAIKNYSRSSTGTAPTIYYGSKAPSCSNISNDEARMSSVVLVNQPLFL